MGDNKGFLTPADREFLRGEKEFSGDNAKQMRYQRRRSIRDRTRDAFRDFSLLFETLDDDELETIAEQSEMRGGGRAMGGPRPPDPSVTDTLAFIYLLHEGQEQFEMSLHRALGDVLRQADQSLFWKIDLDFEQWSGEDIRVLKGKVEEGDIDALSRAEQDFLLERVPVDVLAAALDKQITPPHTRPSERGE